MSVAQRRADVGVAEQALDVLEVRDLEKIGRSCPLAWCSLVRATALSGLGRVGQMTIAGNPTTGSSLRFAMVSRVM